MNDQTYRCFLNLMMASDPSPIQGSEDRALKVFADEEAVKRGYGTWIDAFHGFFPDMEKKITRPKCTFTQKDSDNLADIIWWIITGGHEESLRRARVALDERIK